MPALAALVLEVKYTKQSILESYLNEIYLGQAGFVSIYGVSEAAHRYFGKTLQELTVEEVAIKVEMTSDRVREIQRIAQEPVSLEAPVGDEDDSLLGDFVKGPLDSRYDVSVTRAILPATRPSQSRTRASTSRHDARRRARRSCWSSVASSRPPRASKTFWNGSWSRPRR